MDEYDDTWSWPVASLVDGWPDASVGVPQIGDAVPASAAAQSACFPGFEDLESQNPWSGNLATETADLHKTESRPLAISNTPWQAPNRDMGISADYTTTDQSSTTESGAVSKATGQQRKIVLLPRSLQHCVEHHGLIIVADDIPDKLMARLRRLRVVRKGRRSRQTYEQAMRTLLESRTAQWTLARLEPLSGSARSCIVVKAYITIVQIETHHDGREATGTVTFKLTSQTISDVVKCNDAHILRQRAMEAASGYEPKGRRVSSGYFEAFTYRAPLEVLYAVDKGGGGTLPQPYADKIQEQLGTWL